MASPLQHSVSYPFSADRYWEIVSTEQYWHDLLEATNSSHGRLESFSSDGTTVTVAMLQGVPEDRLPTVVTKVRPGDLEIPRTMTFTRAKDAVNGTMHASVSGAPADVEGALVVSGDPAGAEYTGTAKVGIPFVGGKIESAVIEQLVNLLDNEREKTVTWEADHR
ncbi:DUF2505 domain-containing protein [Gordonia oryzae]|uniref:DUF2505 domain-containing protein n=1 Tax=Gordonia oryzae TaxID=2487349 RepID=A0A3N4GXV3_9ACTN|nr:DUF2505 domain-containing protein [Gordonia oryzae]RPA65556.1 DUF2505 domain-containing protein [Gordonia oryzae]